MKWSCFSYLFPIINIKTVVDPLKVQSILDSSKALLVCKKDNPNEFLINSSSVASISLSKAYSIFSVLIY